MGEKLTWRSRAARTLAALASFALVVAILAAVAVLRWRAETRPGPPSSPAPVAASPSGAGAPAIPSAEQVAAAPHPALAAADNPPPTETGTSVIEDEPKVALPVTEPPPPQANPEERVSVAELPPANLVSAPAAPEPTPPPSKPSLPDWQRLAVAPPPIDGKPMIAVIIDDMGLDRRRSERILELPGPLTISFMSYAQDMAKQEAEARARGDEVMMHVPMEPLDGKIDPGPGVLLEKETPAEVRQTFEADLARFGGVVGINNHMGSKFTAYAPGMEAVMEVLRERGLLFVDSLTTDKSVGLAMARRYGVPAAGRNVFLDNAGDLISVDFELGKLEEVARKKGNAIAIGHPRDATIEALAKWLPTLEAKGFVLVPVSAVVRARLKAEAQTAQSAR